ncbi:septal ring factor EnvC (AmiA/AmiB activator) [Anseongella ginsenosidimutans]|uniref:Septal ring factor EnvC (AmiA/AmiB activator) n=1 Tax=Anseongella ginsenosidimutans TaxID=496056 RepID=A0A4R3KXA6_9SPHI|nr:peptidoglycan DD-metalloendopeptidase family protein [Anseongella ginsenosidimutans]QEC51029.1 peptidoglycan DD-metalloendopeptidase family protein [Anseongella ginsenosidimutans]TCS90315.1 septal ring factor EnvC (AmiA/AmiB activator) [Anseongella ginsenosidimutans]
MQALFKSISVIVVLLLVSLAGYGQTRAELEKRKQQLEKDIAYTQRILNETQKDKSASLEELQALNSQIRNRQKLINNVNSQINVLDNEIYGNQRQIASLREKLEKLQEEYASMVSFAFRNKNSYSKLMFIFAAKDFQQAFRRIRYLQDIGEYRRKQAGYIKETQAALNAEIEKLKNNKSRQVKLLAENEKQRDVLNQDKQQQSAVVSQLQDKEETLKEKLATQQQEARRLDAAITAAIKREIEEARRKAEAAAKARGEAPAPEVSRGSSALALTPEAKALSAGFANNRGKLPWPVEAGVIVSRFGRQEHPVLENVIVDNLGVGIKTDPGAVARAVFEGEVTSIVQIGGNLAVIVKHGEYFTVYSRLKSVLVEQGDKVILKQALGVVRTSPDEGTKVEFQLWKGTVKLNPEYWLYGR